MALADFARRLLSGPTTPTPQRVEPEFYALTPAVPGAAGAGSARAAPTPAVLTRAPRAAASTPRLPAPTAPRRAPAPRAAVPSATVAAPPPKASPRRRRWPQTPEQHARALLDWLQSPGGLTGEIRSDEVQRIHRDMCLALGWDVRPWNPVAEVLTRLTSGRKIYRWFGPSRLRVYPISAVPARTQPADARADSTTPARRAA